MIIPKWLFQEPIDYNFRKLYNPKSIKQIAIENFKLVDKQLNKELAEKLINPFYVTDRYSKVGFNITLESHLINLSNSKFFYKPNYPEFDTEVRYINKIINELSVLYARIINQYNFKYQTVL